MGGNVQINLHQSVMGCSNKSYYLEYFLTSGFRACGDGLTWVIIIMFLKNKCKLFSSSTYLRINTEQSLVAQGRRGENSYPKT